MTDVFIGVECPTCRDTPVKVVKGWNHWYDVKCVHGHESKVEVNDLDIVIKGD